jgi:uncharacterized protein DUF3592
MDEKTQVQALDRTPPVLPITSGKTRNASTTMSGILFTALNAGTCEVTGRCYPVRDGANFLTFLKATTHRANGSTGCWTACPPTARRRFERDVPLRRLPVAEPPEFDLASFLELASAVIVSGAISFWLRASDKRKASRFRRRGVGTTGIVIKHEVREVKIDTASDHWHRKVSPVVRFNDLQGNEVRFVSTLITHPRDTVPIGSQVEVIYPPDTPERAEIADAIGNRSAGHLDRSGQFVSSSWGCFGIFFVLFVFLSVLFVFIGMVLVGLLN